MSQTDATLGVDLKVRIEVDVAERPFEAARGWGRPIRAVLIVVTVDVLLVLGETNTNRDASAVVGWAEVPGIGGATQESWVVGTPGQAAGLRRRVAVVR